MLRLSLENSRSVNMMPCGNLGKLKHSVYIEYLRNSSLKSVKLPNKSIQNSPLQNGSKSNESVKKKINNNNNQKENIRGTRKNSYQ